MRCVVQDFSFVRKQETQDNGREIALVNIIDAGVYKKQRMLSIIIPIEIRADTVFDYGTGGRKNCRTSTR